MNLSENIPLARLLDLCAARLSIRLQYDPAAFEENVKIRAEDGITNQELWTLTNRLLASRGYTSVQAPGEDTILVLKLDRAPAVSRVVSPPLSNEKAGYLKVAVPLRHREPERLAKALSPFLSDIGKATAMTESSQILLSDLAPYINKALLQIEDMDTEDHEAVSEEIRLQHTAASKLVSLLSSPPTTAKAVPGAIRALPDEKRILLEAPRWTLPSWQSLIASFDRDPEYPTLAYKVVGAPLSEIVKTLETHFAHPDRSDPTQWRVAEDSLTHSVVVTADRQVHESVERLLGEIALNAQDRIEVEEYLPQHASSTSLVTLSERIQQSRKALEEDALEGTLMAAPDREAILIVAPKSAQPQWLSLLERFDTPSPIDTVTYAPGGFPIADVARLIESTIADTTVGEWRLVVDDLTGTLIVTASMDQHRQIETLLERLDATVAEQPQTLRPFVIKNRPAKEIAVLLQELLSPVMGSDAVVQPEQTTGNPQTTPRSPQREPARTEPPGEGSRDEKPHLATFTVDPSTNTLLVVGDPALLSQVESLLLTLDVKEPQVLIEVMVVTLNDTDSLDLGVELRRRTERGDYSYLFESLFGLDSPPLTGTQPDLTSAVGGSAVVLNPGEFSAVVRALQVINEGRSLTMPKVLVNNNQQGQLSSVLQTPFSSINASDTIATTSFGGTQDAGTTITINPQISDQDRLLLHYSIALSAFVGEAADVTLPPPRQQNHLESTASIPDGHTVVVGGLEIESETESRTKIPLLGDIPFIGELFSSRSLTKTHSRFFVFIRASVLRHDRFDELRYLTDDLLRETDLEEDWPATEPQVIR